MPYLVERYEPWQRKRFAVPQGITGWWQVNGRSDRLMHLHTEDDLYYVQNYSLLLDILILIKTVGTVLRGKGAF
jgi:lipopolysaccharide/colanic/teichoic acid biosynthesis glycosyltransferase